MIESVYPNSLPCVSPCSRGVVTDEYRVQMQSPEPVRFNPMRLAPQLASPVVVQPNSLEYGLGSYSPAVSGHTDLITHSSSCDAMLIEISVCYFNHCSKK